MLAEAEVRAIAQNIVNQSKNTARVDTGALKRSISYTYVRGVVTFRELYYGQYGTNSKLEKNAERLMPNGIEWRIIYTDFGGNTRTVGRTRTGRRTQSSAIASAILSGTSKIKALINKVRGKEKNQTTD